MNITKKRFLTLVYVAIVVAMFFGIFNLVLNFKTDKYILWDKVSATTSLNGEGTAENPYIIASADDLFLLANSIDTTENNAYNNKYYIQTQNIDLTNQAFYGIGNNLSTSITINYDGMGHIITAVQNGTSSHFSFFGSIQNSCIQNLHIEHLGVNVNITENNVSKNIGVFADYAFNSKIQNCSLNMVILNLQANNLTNVNVGGFVGFAKDCILLDCFCKDVKLFNQFGCDNLNLGLFVGKAEDSKISTCFADGRLTQNGSVQYANIGSFVGLCDAEILNCYAMLTNGFEFADITLLQNANIGGFVGLIKNVTDTECCYVLTTFTNQNYSSKNVGLFAGYITDGSNSFSNCYTLDYNGTFYDMIGTSIFDASNLSTINVALDNNYYLLSTYLGFSNLIWKENFNISQYPSLFGVGEDLSDIFEAKQTDSFGRTKGYFESIENCVQNISSNDIIYILKEEISFGSLQIQNNVTISSNFAVEFNIEESNATYVFVLTDGADLCIDGNFVFKGLQDKNIGFATGEGNETLVLRHSNIYGFNNETLIDDLNVELYDSIIQNNFAQNLMNANNVSIKKSIINQNKDILNKNSVLNIETIQIDGYENVLDICLMFSIDITGANIQRTGLTDVLSDINSTIDIKIANDESEWLTNKVLVQGNTNLIYDNISYVLTNSPKFTQTNFSKFVLKQVDSQLLLGGQLFDIEYFDNQTGNYQKYFGKDKFDENMPQVYEYGVNLAINDLQNDNMQFVGWFGYDERINKYYDNNHSFFTSLYDSNLSSSKAIELLDTSFVAEICFYDVPTLTGGNQTFGKFTLYSKWQVTFVVEMQEETNVGGETQYTASLDAGILCIDDNVYTTNVSNIAYKQVYVGQSLKLTAFANQNYTFVGWWQETVGQFVKYNKYQYEYDADLNAYVLNINVTDSLTTRLYAHYIKNAYIINLLEIFKNEYNIQTPVQIFSSEEQILYASIKKGGVDYVGKQYLTIIDNELVLRNDEKVILQIDPKNYHLDLSPDKRIRINAIQNNLFPKYEFNESNYQITLENNVGCGYGSLTICLEKNYHAITLKYGSNQTKNNFVGGDCEISETYIDSGNTIYSTFGHNTNQKMTEGELKTISKTANIYFGTSIIIYLNTQDGYRFDASNTIVQDLNRQRVDFVIIKENDIPQAIVINNVNKDIEVLISFKKTYCLQFLLSEINIDGTEIKIGELQIESEDWTTDSKTKIVDKDSSIDFKTRQTSWLGPYQFVKWIVTSNGQPIDIDEMGLTENDLRQKELLVHNISQNLEFTAFYNKSNVRVSVVWNGKNGTVTNSGAKALGNDSYEIEYDTDILLVITPKTKKYFIKRLECENVDLQTQIQDNEDGGTNYVLKNVLVNTKVYLEIVVDSWLEHLEQNEFYGDGTKESPYIISTPSELQLIAKFVNNKVQAQDGKTNYNIAYYRLANDIDLGEDYYFVPIGTASNPFGGTFDYNFYAIKNIVTEPNAYLIDNSLFYIMGKDGKVINQHHSSMPIIISIISIIITIFITVVVVLIIEKKRKRPRKVIVLNDRIRKNVE